MISLLEELKQKDIHLAADSGILKVTAPKGVMTVELSERIKTHKPQLLHFLSRQDNAMSWSIRKLQQIDRSGPIAASFSQQRLWLTDQLEGSQHYNIAVALACEGPLDIAALQFSLDQIMARHEVLRTHFVEIEGECYQQVAAAGPFGVLIENLSGEQVDSVAVQARINAEAMAAFDLSQDLMLRVRVLVLSETQHILLFTMHHIASDGWSMQLLIKEFNAFYQQSLTGVAAEVAPLNIQYGDYAHWQRSCLSAETREGLLRYWRKRLADIPSLHGLPLDNPRPPQQRFDSGAVRSVIQGETWTGLKALVQRQGVTLFMVLQGALSVLLSRVSGETDIVLGVPTAGRHESELAPLIGFFINTLVSRTQVDVTQPFAALLQQIKVDTLADYQHQMLPFEMLVGELKPERSLAYNPLCQIKLVLQNHRSSQDEALKLGAATFRPLSHAQESIRFDLDLTCSEGEQELVCHWRYQTSLFAHTSIEAYARSFEQLLMGIVQAPERACGAYPLFDEVMQAALLAQSQGEASVERRDRSVVAQFAAQAQQSPDRVAVVDSVQSLSYRELSLRVNQLAHYLQEQEIGAGARVALVMERGVSLLIGMLGVMTAGASYIPLSPQTKTSRLAEIFADAEVTLVLVSGHELDSLPVSGVDVLMLDAQEWLLSEYEVQTPEFDDAPQDSAYVIYTSGSTGRPKGVDISQRGLSDYCGYALNSYYAKHLSGSYVVTSHAFDIGVPSLYLPLLVGDTVTLAPWGHELSALAARLKRAGAPELYRMTPMHAEALLQLLDVSKIDPAHVLVIGGESLTVDLAKRLQATFVHSQIYNHYGPTETVVGCCMYDVSGALTRGLGRWETLPIGYAMENTGLYVVDAYGGLQVSGGIGELYIGGPGVAKGYLNDEAKNAAAFVQASWSGERLYRTGDWVRRQADGALLFLGRRDEQVKLRGYRVELGEIRAVLEQQAQISQAAVLVQGEGEQAELVGYLVAKEVVSDEASFIKGVESRLKQRLADYLVPAKWRLLETLPLTANGKLDKRALPALDGSMLRGEYVAPQSEIEQALVEIWSELLGVNADQLSTQANFFELGGHSLLSVRLVARIRQRIGVDLPVKAIFETNSLAGLAAAMTDQQCKAALPPVEAIGRTTNRHPVSFAQQRLWFIDQLQGGTPEYNMPMVFEVQGAVDIAVVNRVFKQIIDRHEVLRSIYVEEGGRVTQLIQDRSDVVFEVSVEEMAHLTGETQSSKVRAQVKADILQPFDLSKDLMVRVRYFRTSALSGVLLFNMHHIASDGWSMEVLSKEFFNLYQAYTQGKESPLQALAIQYADYAHWQRTYLAGAVLEQRLSYWERQLENVPLVHGLPLSYPRPERKAYQGAAVSGHLSAEVAQRLQGLAKQHQLTPFMLLHGALCLLLSRLSGSADIVIGAPVANRMQAELSPLIGFFVNMLVLRVGVKHASLLDYFKHVRQVHLDAQSNQDVPFEQLVERLKIPRTQAHSPLFQIMLTTNTDYGLNTDSAEVELEGIKIRPYQSDTLKSKFDLDISLSISEHGVHIHWTYDVSLFSEETVSRWSSHLCRLLTGLSEITDAKSSPHHLPLLSEAEQTHLVSELNATACEYPRDKCIHELFESQAHINPNNVAVVFEDTQLTYKALNERANQLAHYLVEEHHVKPDTLVGLCVERSLDMVVGMLGILKAGGAYVSLDPSYPQARLEYMIEDASLATIVSHGQVTAVLSEFTGQIIALDEQDTFAHYSTQNVAKSGLGLSSSNLAYVIYTSGSTGKPKGVMVEHISVANFLTAMQGNLGVKSSDKILGLTSINFDIHVLEVFLTWQQSATLILANETQKRAPVQLISLVEQYEISYLQVTPSTLKMLLDADWKTPRPLTILSGGEALSAHCANLLSAYLPNSRLFNVYGPTETTVWSSIGQLLQKEGQTECHLGKAISNTQLYILDEHQQLLPYGSAGELYIGGAGLTRGYLNRPELTAERFIKNPYYDATHADSSACLYRTGDLVRYSPDGHLVFIGRVDDQVKIRGYRIELGEIESQLSAQEGVNSALVMVKELVGSQQLVGYIKLRDELDEEAQMVLVKQVKTGLSVELPDYMVPSVLMVVTEWPLTANGKVDKRALPAPVQTKQFYRAARTLPEQQLQALWSELLSIPIAELSCDANFFALGGDSILSIQLVSRAAARGLHFSVKDLFQHQTIESLSPWVKASKAHTVSQEDVSGEMSLLPIQHSFFSNEAALWHYNQSVLLGTPEHFDKSCLLPILTVLLKRHDALRLKFYKTVEGWQAEHAAVSAAQLADFIQCVAWDGTSHSLTEAAEQVQVSLSPTNGDLLRLVYFEAEHGEGRLLFVIHHLVVDGVSWRILLADIAQLYEQYQANRPLVLAAKTNSYQEWGAYLKAYSESPGLQQERAYWRAAEQASSGCWEAGYGQGAGVVSGQRRQLSLKLDKTRTQALLSDVPKSYRTQVNEVLLTGLWLANRACSGRDTLAVTLEGHGRSPENDKIDLSQTVGWFTSMYPLRLACEAQDIGTVLMRLKEQYRAVPNAGLGYGVLKYLSAEKALVCAELPALQFNYLGQFDQTMDAVGAFTVAVENTGQHISAQRIAGRELVLNGKVMFGELSFTLNYNSGYYDEAQLTAFMQAYQESLEAIIEHCQQVGLGPYTPSDFPLAKVTQDSLQVWQQDKEIEDLYPATGMQQGLLFHSLLEAGSYVTQTRVSFKGLNVAAFKGAWSGLLQSHGIFRTGFVGVESGQAHQRVEKAVPLGWHEEDLSQMTSAEQAQYLDDYQERDKRRGFDITAAPLMRCSLFKQGDEQTLLWSIHHALLDGWCIPLVFGEINRRYEALLAGQAEQEPPRYSYRDYAQWLSQQDIAATKRYWQDELKDIESHTELPLNEGVASTTSVEYRMEFSAAETAALQGLAARVQTTLNIVVQTAWGLLLKRYGNHDAVVFGTVTSGRPSDLAGVESILGLFINTVPVVLDVKAQDDVRELLVRQHTRQVERESHSYYPLYEIQKLGPLKEGLFSSVFVFENYPIDKQLQEQGEGRGLQVTHVETTEGTNYDLAVVAHVSQGLTIRLEGGAGKYNEASLARIGGHYRRILLGLVAVARVDELEMLSEQERGYLLEELNATAVSYEQDVLLHELFERQAEQHPAAIAVVSGGERLSYQALNEQANRLCEYLQSHPGFEPGHVVGLYVQRSAQMMVGILAILKAGGTYLPLDPSYPAQRIKYMLEDSAATCVLTEADLPLESEITRIYIADALESSQPFTAKSDPSCSSSDVAYIIYTSGTTGNPKGVAIRHQSAVDLAFSLARQLPSGLGARVLQFSVQSFDASVFEWIWAITQGASLYICSDETKLQPQEMASYLEQHQITHTCLTPSYLAYLPNHERYSFQVLGVVGEACSEELAWRWAQQYPVFNLYGPTEITICASFAAIKVNEPVNIGGPMVNTEFYVVNADQQLCPFGVTGELYIAGKGLAKEYVNQPSLTAHKFVKIPAIAAEKRMYRTGDLVRYLPNGQLEYRGRADEQIKIRGHRVEPGEVERQLCLLDNILKAVVKVGLDSQGHKRMLAYIELQRTVSQTAEFIEAVRNELRSKLPLFMVPATIMVITEWPYLPNGKVDKSALPNHCDEVSRQRQGPRNEVEHELVMLWQMLLDVPHSQIDIRDHFMELGGHSLLLVRLLNEVNNRWALNLALTELIANPDIESLGEITSRSLAVRSIREQASKAEIVAEGTL